MAAAGSWREEADPSWSRGENDMYSRVKGKMEGGGGVIKK